MRSGWDCLLILLCSSGDFLEKLSKKVSLSSTALLYRITWDNPTSATMKSPIDTLCWLQRLFSIEFNFVVWKRRGRKIDSEL